MGYEYPSAETEWNSNQATLERLDSRLRDCYDARMFSTMNGLNPKMLGMWSSALTGVYSVIYPKLMNKERTEINELFQKRNNIGKIMEEKNTSEGKIRQINVTNFYKHWNLYNKIELRLTELADSRGMLMTDADSGTSAASTL